MKNNRLLILTQFALLTLVTSPVYCQLTGNIIFELNNSASPTNPIPWAATVSNLSNTGWQNFNIGPSFALGTSDTNSPTPALGLNEISFDIDPICSLCVLTGIDLDIYVGPIANTGIFQFQLFQGAIPVSAPIAGPVGGPPVPTTYTIPFAPISLTGPTTFSIAFSHNTTSPITGFSIDNINLSIAYDAACIPEPQASLYIFVSSLALLLLLRLRKKYSFKNSKTLDVFTA